MGQEGAQMVDKPIKNLVVVGGGTAGWMAAAMLAKWFEGSDLSIRVVESDEIGAVGVGEATVPFIRKALQFLGIKEQDFIAGTQATLKLAIKFDGWRGEGEAFYHPFSRHGEPINELDFYDYWVRAHHEGNPLDLDLFSTGVQLAHARKFAMTKPDGDGLSNFNFAYHFDAGLVGQFLRARAEQMGVVRTARTHCRCASGR